MTLALMKESRPMKHLPDHAQQPERPQSLDELRCRLNRRLSDLCEGWARCDHRLCKRWKQCCGEGPDFKCTDDGPAAADGQPGRNGEGHVGFL
jgi:hypothetical protein